MATSVQRTYPLSGSDPCLLPYLRAGDADADRVLGRAVHDHADAVITRVVARMLGLARKSGPKVPARSHSQDLEDVCSQARMQLVARLQDLRAGRASEPIRSLRAYAAAVAYQVGAHHLRAMRPRRERLKNQLRCLFARQAGLALWDAKPVGWLCGYASWREEGRGLHVGRRYQGLLSNPTSALSAQHLPLDSLGALAVAVLNWVGGPVELEDLVTIIARLLGVEGEPASLRGEAGEWMVAVDLDEVPDTETSPDQGLEMRLYLQYLWDEIRRLPIRQRHAVLLGLDEIAVFPVLGVASLARIADVLEIAEGDLAALWTNLPLEDAAIARRLGLTRQQVSNLRKSARERLRRRMREKHP
jgi:RNA polymerase sigma factor (sigma-70 family)